jgi:hypothetical protein
MEAPLWLECTQERFAVNGKMIYNAFHFEKIQDWRFATPRNDVAETFLTIWLAAAGETPDVCSYFCQRRQLTGV